MVTACAIYLICFAVVLLLFIGPACRDPFRDYEGGRPIWKRDADRF